MAKTEIPHHSLGEIRNALLPQDVTRSDSLELKVRTKSAHITVIDFVAFLEVGDRVYGAFAPPSRGSDGHRAAILLAGVASDLRAYRHGGTGLLQIENVEAGSLDWSFIQSLANIVNSHSIITMMILWNLLRIDKVTLSAKHIAEAFLAYQQGAQIREQRQAKRLSEDTFAPIALFLEELFKHQGTTLKRARRFARENVIEITTRVKRERQQD